MRAGVVVITQGQGRPRAYDRSLLAIRKLHQAFISDAHGMIVKIAREALELLRGGRGGNGGLSRYYLLPGYGLLWSAGLPRRRHAGNRQTAAEQARQEHRPESLDAGRRYGGWRRRDRKARRFRQA